MCVSGSKLTDCTHVIYCCHHWGLPPLPHQKYLVYLHFPRTPWRNRYLCADSFVNLFQCCPILHYINTSSIFNTPLWLVLQVHVLIYNARFAKPERYKENLKKRYKLINLRCRIHYCIEHPIECSEADSLHHQADIIRSQYQGRVLMVYKISVIMISAMYRTAARANRYNILSVRKQQLQWVTDCPTQSGASSLKVFDCWASCKNWYITMVITWNNPSAWL